MPKRKYQTTQKTPAVSPQGVTSPEAAPSTAALNENKKVESRALAQLRDEGASEMWLSHFSSHSLPLPPPNTTEAAKKAEERANCHYCQLRSFPSSKRFPVGIINEVDTSCIDASFRFIEENIVGPHVEFAAEEFLSGCQCRGGEDCKTEDCTCLGDLDRPDLEECGGDLDVNPYYTEKDDPLKKDCLKDWMLNSRRPIYECTARCKCGPGCPNRVVGAGRQVALQVFKTADGRGWGLQATEDIKKGQFVGKYVGELLSPAAAQQRRLASKAAGKKDIYLFALDKFHDTSSADPRFRREPYEIDGELASGPTRFINHSCDPNLRVFAVVNDHANKPVHDLCFFATREIERFTELTFDYVDGVDGVKALGRRGRPSKRDMEERRGGTECLCGAKKCRKFLW